jgi:hypothetical protein
MAEDNNIIYLPMGLTLDDKNCIYNGELLELMPAKGGSDGYTTSMPTKTGRV